MHIPIYESKGPKWKYLVETDGSISLADEVEIAVN